MNLIKANIKSITTKQNLNLVEVVFDGETIFMLSLELPSNLKKNDHITLGIKPMNIAISKDFHVDTSFLNQIKISVISIEIGEILTVVQGVINGIIIESVITTKAFYRIGIDVGDSLIMLLPASELFIV